MFAHSVYGTLLGAFYTLLHSPLSSVLYANPVFFVLLEVDPWNPGTSFLHLTFLAWLLTHYFYFPFMFFYDI